MLQQNLSDVFERDLNKLKTELLAYEDESKLWATAPGISNSTGNLALHLIGNLNNFIGSVLGHTGYIRNRDAEFALKDIPRTTIIANIDNTIEVVKAALTGLSNEQLEEIYPEDKWKDPVTVHFLLLHLLSHLNYHLGQINYHRRLVG
jgi:uncharacterized damage-inducible protein DinB